ncbi:UNVERIFIED_CONTAM: Uridine kinase-like protein 1, chloroplastic [Sesamum angustifolium]|uniref:Uridine kinase-like protein 1, chloroplastic n=1 Tax=Sesamum angustifolium TaxID=2727405 RepID=A0AAW2RR16_9LAMI
MADESKAIDYVMEASPPTLLGRRLNSLAAAAAAAAASPTPTPSSYPVRDFPTHKQPFVIGKTTVCDMIIQQLHDHRVVLVNQDSFYRGLTPAELKRVHEYNFDHPDADVRLARRIRRDTVERGRDINSVLEQYAKFVKPAFDDFILPSKKYADVVIPRGGDNHVAIDLIVQHIRTKLGQHDLCKIYPNVYVIQSTFQIRGMHTLIRDRDISKHDFVFYSDRVIRLVVEHGLGHLPFTEKQVVTPTVGESMENALRACCKGIKIGKILIHRHGDNGKQLIYEKLPKDICERHVLLLDPVLATGNSANEAIELLIQKGVPESHIIFLNLISAPEGIHRVCKRFPLVKIVTSEIDAGLNGDFQVIPGMGEFGDRYFGTDD